MFNIPPFGNGGNGMPPWFGIPGFDSLTPNPKVRPDLPWLIRKFAKSKVKDYAEIAEAQADIFKYNQAMIENQKNFMASIITFGDQIQDQVNELQHKRKLRELAEKKEEAEVMGKLVDVSLAQSKLKLEELELKVKQNALKGDADDSAS